MTATIAVERAYPLPDLETFGYISSERLAITFTYLRCFAADRQVGKNYQSGEVIFIPPRDEWLILHFTLMGSNLSEGGSLLQNNSTQAALEFADPLTQRLIRWIVRRCTGLTSINLVQNRGQR